jgi:exopolysaccharide biosynthesis protein
MLLKKYLSVVFIIFATVMCAQSENQISQNTKTLTDSLNFTQIKTDSIFNSNQIISLLTVQKSDFKKMKIEFGFSKSDLKKTSSFAKSKNALAAINGGFFNIDDGGSVSYFEINDSVISRQRNPELKWGVSDNIINGAIVIVNDSIIRIEQALSEQFYESSNKELAVLITGPVLLLNSETISLPQKKFVTNRHPRTCLCKKRTSLVFITIDGRSKEAEGMNLFEVQDFLLSIGCVDAINLDGGGSTTMWIHNKGVVNFPSDKTGERPVSNVLLLLHKKQKTAY